MNVLALNAGGGSSRAMLYATSGEPPLEPPAPLWTREIEENDAPLPKLFADFPDTTIDIVAHRVVHGGLDPARGLDVTIDRQSLAMIRAAVPLAPSHNRAALDGIAFARKRFPGAKHVAVFDDVLDRDCAAVRAHRDGTAELGRTLRRSPDRFSRDQSSRCRAAGAAFARARSRKDRQRASRQRCVGMRVRRRTLRRNDDGHDADGPAR